MGARGEEVLVVLSMVSEMGPVFLRVDLVPMRRSSALSLLSLRKLCAGQLLRKYRIRCGSWVDFVLMYVEYHQRSSGNSGFWPLGIVLYIRK